ncbi:hypothetical protein DYB32_001079 [Aphanomyces invadans]|uniref:Ankyrin repeat domain-containing protein n=1 Tax=Aphanomyces invadans TaxID=157072 RepID=A0A3R6YFF3_9STRA|nr:hypothetical protein DYB32_001079 [Aphanomyces invadans]
MRVLKGLQVPRFDSHDLLAAWMHVDAVLAPWLALHKMSRLKLLFSCLPHLKHVVAIHAAITGNVPLLKHLHSQLNVLMVTPYYVVDFAAWSGHFDALVFLLSIRHRGMSAHALSQAARHGYVQIVQFLLRHLHSRSPTAVVAAASNGHLNIVELLCPDYQDTIDDEAMDVAAAGGHLDVVKWLYNRGSRSWRALLAAAKHGHTHVMEYLLGTSHKNWGPVSMDNAASMNYLDVLRCLQNHPHVASQHRAIDAAATNGHFEAVRLLHDMKLAKASVKAMDDAASRGWLNIVAFLHEHNAAGCTLAAMDNAAAHGHLDVVKYLHKHRNEGCSTDAMDWAATRGHLDMVQFLHKHRHEGCTTDALDGAASRGHLDVVKYLHAHRSEGFTEVAIDRASLNNHPEVVEFLVTCGRGRVTSSCAIDAAVAHGNDHLVDFLLTHGHHPSVNALESCAWCNDVEMFEKIYPLVEPSHARANAALEIVAYAASAGHLTLLQSAMRLGCVTTPPDLALVGAAKHGHLEVVKVLAPLYHHRPLAALDEAATCGHADVVKYLDHVAFPCTCRAMDGAATNGHLHLLKWLAAHRQEGWTTDAFDGACRNGHLNVVQWLYPQRQIDISPDALTWAVDANCLKLVEWLTLTGRTHFNVLNAMSCAAANGSLPILAHLVEVYSTWSEMDGMAVIAAAGGHLDMVKWILSNSNRRESIEEAMKAAKHAQRPIVVSYLHTISSAETLDDQAVDDDEAEDGDEDIVDVHSDTSDGGALLEQAMELADDSSSDDGIESEYEEE